MSNTTTGGWETEISSRIQKFLDRATFFRQLANFEENNKMKNGREVNRPIFTPELLTLNSYTANTDVTPQDWTYTQEKMVVNFEKECAVSLDPFEELDLQVPGVQSLLAKRLRQTMSIGLDRDFFDEVSNAAITVDDSDFGGTADAPIDLSVVAPNKVYGRALAKLNANAVGEGTRFAVIDPYIQDDIENLGIDTTYDLSDKYFVGKMANMFRGFQIFVSNNLPSTVDFTYSGTGVTAKDFSINGVVFHQLTTIGTAAGNVLMVTNATTSATNVKNFINDPSTTSANQVALSALSQKILKRSGIAATSVAGVVTITGYGRLALAVDAGSNSTFGDQTVSSMCGLISQSIDMVVQMEPTVQINKESKNAGHTLLGIVRAATKTYEEGAQRLVEVKIKG